MFTAVNLDETINSFFSPNTKPLYIESTTSKYDVKFETCVVIVVLLL